MKEIPLTQGKVALVDDEDYKYLSRRKWCANKNGLTYYASRRQQSPEGKSIIVYMHREILPVQGSIDHIDRNGLNNQKSNLRAATHSQNQYNKSGLGGTSKYKGVCWHKASNRWRSQIQLDAHVIHIGVFRVEEDAARAYDAKAIELFGEFAVLNFLKEANETT